jgi:hypothetical protein
MNFLLLNIFFIFLKIQINAAQHDLNAAIFPKIENFHPPEGYQPVKGYEPINYKPNRKYNEFSIQTKKINFQTPEFISPSYYNPNYPNNKENNRYNNFNINYQASNSQTGYGSNGNAPNYPIIPTTREVKSFNLGGENWRRTPPSMFKKLYFFLNEYDEIYQKSMNYKFTMSTVLCVLMYPPPLCPRNFAGMARVPMTSHDLA